MLHLAASKCAPLTLHGDGDRSYNQKSVYVLSFSSMLTHGGRWTSRWLIAAIPEETVVDETYETLFRFLKWSFDALLRGAYPESGFDGKGLDVPRQRLAQQPLDGELGLRGAFMGVTGDLKALKERHHFQQSYDRVAMPAPRVQLSELAPRQQARVKQAHALQS